MQQLGSKTITVDGVTVFSDHADPDQFWYLPAPVRLRRRAEDDRAAFTFIKYKPAAVAGGAKGGGFLMFETDLRLSPEQERKILSRVSGMSRGTPKLAAVPIDEGTVRCVALNLEGGGGTTADAAGPGTFNAVETILGATTPSLAGDNTAAFSLTLSQEGATILEQAFEQGTTPVGVIYDLKYSALRPALDVKITADMKRVHDHFSASLSGSYYFIELGVEVGLEKLKQEGAIKIEVTDFDGADDREQKEKWALDFFKDHLLSEWFEPTLKPSAVDQATSAAGGVADAVRGITGGNGTPSNGTSSPPSGTANGGGGTATPRRGTPARTGGTGGGGGTATATQPAAARATAPATTRLPAALRITRTEPTPKPAGYDIAHAPASTGTRETLRFTGGARQPVVKVNGQPKTLGADRTLTLDVPHGTELRIEAEYPRTAAATETFKVFFDYDKPEGDPAGNLPPARLQSYLANAPQPSDRRFTQDTSAPSGSTQTGANALREWVQNSLAEPKTVTVDAHASFEGHTNTRVHNQQLTDRRALIASEVIGTTANKTHVLGHGQTEAETAGRVSNRNADSDDRVVKVIGTTRAEEPRVLIEATLGRPALPTQPVIPPPPPPVQPGRPTPPTRPTAPTEIPGAPKIALKLKFIRREEQKKITLHYNRTQAVQRVYAPQGFVGLLLADLENPREHFVEVDLDDPFFRTFGVDLEAPIDFDRIGLASAQVALDYGSRDDAQNHRHGDFVFDPDDQGAKRFEIFMNAQRDTSYAQGLQFHFDPGSGWDSDEFSYEIPTEQTEDRTLLINPFNHLGFLEAKILPGDIDFGVVESIEVHLRHENPGGTPIERVITLQENTPEQLWRVRTQRRNEREFTARVVTHLTDGTTKEADPIATKATTIVVDDPFDDALRIEFVPLLDASQTRMVFVDFEYDDVDNDYQRRERLRIDASQTEPVSLRISLVDPAKRNFRIRQTVVGLDNQMRRGAFIETDDTLISVTEP